jgi:hypothetical protein
MLEELMHRLEHDLKRPVRPCEYFHLITGVGAAGYAFYSCMVLLTDISLESLPFFWGSWA